MADPDPPAMTLGAPCDPPQQFRAPPRVEGPSALFSSLCLLCGSTAAHPPGPAPCHSFLTTSWPQI